jgi:hypothetical protein
MMPEATTSNKPLPSPTTTPMAEPTKQETEQVFKVLKAQKANKVLTGLHLIQKIINKRDK